MSHLSIKDVPERIAAQLRERAARNHRSLQGELMAIITEAAQPAAIAPETKPPLQGWRRGTRTIEELFAERRDLYPEPIRSGPLGVDIIRKDRDSR